MQSSDIPKVASLLVGTLCLIGFIVWNVLRSDLLEQRLLDELNEVAELDNELCPFDGSLIGTSRVLLFDFSDPLPAAASDYPNTLLENMLEDSQDAARFDHFGLYTLNPYGGVPRKIGAFCVPVTMSQIPRDVRRALWGADPTQHAQLPSRYERYNDVFDHLWQNDQELRASMDEARNNLISKARNIEQEFSRIIENIEELVGLEIDRKSQRVDFVILSDMLQNSPTYSHYRNPWDFKEYLSRRSGDLPNMRRFSFQIYFVQSCQSITTVRRRSLQQFWEDYFDHSDAVVRFKLLSIDSGSCQPEGSNTSRTSEPLPPLNVQTGNEEPRVPREEEAHTPSGTIADSSSVERATPIAKSSKEALDENDAGDVMQECPKPEAQALPTLSYPRNARGSAILRYRILVDDRGRPVELVLYDAEIDLGRYRHRFVEKADDYIRRLRFNVQADDNCSGGRSTLLSLRYDE